LLFRFTTDVFENFVHLFKLLTGSLGNTEESEEECEKAEAREESVCTRPGVLDEGWSDEALTRH
jgi:BRCT domain type II-containing protein